MTRFTSIEGRHNAAKFDIEDASREFNISIADLLQIIYNINYDLGYDSVRLVEFIDDKCKDDEAALEVAYGIKVTEGY